jgi:8-oxo-dGTP diphosphatase
MIGSRIGEKHFTASALIEHDGQFLLLYHAKLGKWLYPGGHVEANEEPQDALNREIKEETGMVVSIVSCGAGLDLPLDLAGTEVEELPLPLAILCEKIAKDDDFHWHVDLVYVCEVDRVQFEKCGNLSDRQWVTPKEASTLNCPQILNCKRSAYRESL